MSALARTDINTVTNKLTTALNSAKKNSVITEISVTARIDYILRFSKQVVLVIAEEAEQYSTIARQFLVTLSSDSAKGAISQNNPSNHQCNVAFLSASVKLNDIQIRCRLIEQLFSNSLFDPEQSLSVSLLRLAKQQDETITIVVEHAHALSLQVKYELSQLVAIAKKTNQVINVVMFAQPQAAAQIGDNKSIFKNKLAIVDAVSGQLYSIDANKKSADSDTKWLKPWQKLVLFTSVLLMVLVSTILFYYLQTEQGNKYLQQPLIAKSTDAFIESQFVVINEKPNDSQLLNTNQQNLLSESVDNKLVKTANAQEINKVLVSPELIVVNARLPAKTNDVLSALLVKEGQVADVTQLANRTPEVISLKENEQSLINDLNSNYYFTMSEQAHDGVVVQIAGFSDSQHWHNFLALYPQQELYSYQKILSGSVFTVVTSKVYPNRILAKEALQALPEAITQRELWLKPISTVIAEINTFKE